MRPRPRHFLPVARAQAAAGRHRLHGRPLLRHRAPRRAAGPARHRRAAGQDEHHRLRLPPDAHHPQRVLPPRPGAAAAPRPCAGPSAERRRGALRRAARSSRGWSITASCTAAAGGWSSSPTRSAASAAGRSGGATRRARRCAGRAPGRPTVDARCSRTHVGQGRPKSRAKLSGFRLGLAVKRPGYVARLVWRAIQWPALRKSPPTRVSAGLYHGLPLHALSVPSRGV